MKALRTFLLRGKLQRAVRQAKRLHFLQRRARKHIEELDEERKAGKVEPAAYEERKAKLQAQRHDLVEKLKVVEEEERRLRAELKSLAAARA